MTETITTPEALDALPRWTVGHDALGQVCERAFGGPGFVWRMTGTRRKYEAAGIDLPFTVLYRPDAPAPSTEDREALAARIETAITDDGHREPRTAETRYVAHVAAGVALAARQPETDESATATVRRQALDDALSAVAGVEPYSEAHGDALAQAEDSIRALIEEGASRG